MAPPGYLLPHRPHRADFPQRFLKQDSPDTSRHGETEVAATDAAFRLVNSVGIATSRVFGAESSRPASLLCTLRTHQSPGEWQHRFRSVCSTVTERDFHPLDSIKKFHRSSRFLLFQTFPQRDDNVGGVKQF